MRGDPGKVKECVGYVEGKLAASQQFARKIKEGDFSVYMDVQDLLREAEEKFFPKDQGTFNDEETRKL